MLGVAVVASALAAALTGPLRAGPTAALFHALARDGSPARSDAACAGAVAGAALVLAAALVGVVLCARARRGGARPVRAGR